jgi:hypothetical protein
VYINEEDSIVCADGMPWPPYRQLFTSPCTRSAVMPARQRKEYAIGDMAAAARAHGGSCVSAAYANMSTKLTWRCELGHEWEATPFSVIHGGTWCPVCARQALHKGATIDQFHELAAGRGGECLSWAYRNANELLEWRCARGHVWSASASHVKRGSWCPTCAKSAKSPTHTIEEMRSLAEARGGACLSAEYEPGRVLVWRCKHGHEWHAKGSAIVRGHWCQACAAAERKDKPLGTRDHLHIEAARSIAEQRGGECLSDEYIAGPGKMRWHCASGHVWDARFQEVARGTWCPLCARPGKGRGDGEAVKEFSIRASRPYTTGGKPARYLFVRRVWPGDEAGAKLVVNSLIMQVTAGELPPLLAGDATADAYTSGSTSALALVRAEYPDRPTALASVHVPSGAPCGWLILSALPTDPPETAVDLYLDPRFQERDFVAPVWKHVPEMADAWLPAVKTGEKIPIMVPGRLVPSKIAAIVTTSRFRRSRKVEG